ncbi:hypothetical protein [Micromonospora aurantiaca (nom. illeg.)]|uniref:hypothetical protein n=1 Tax=Micromonospora aurantiaca (nom. illeg.) TaxID=47850 RepID=UPI0033CAC47D
MTIILVNPATLCPACGEEIDPTVDLDHVAIDRALAGDITVQLTRAERYEAIRIGVRRGLNLNQAARRIGMNGQERRLAIAGVQPPSTPRSRAGNRRGVARYVGEDS